MVGTSGYGDFMVRGRDVVGCTRVDVYLREPDYLVCVSSGA